MNLDLLKPFDLEAAKRGEEICWYDGEATTFIAEAGPDGHHVVRWEDGNLHFTGTDRMRMRLRPLAWVEDRPVYKGDVLYSRGSGLKFSPNCFENGSLWSASASYPTDYLTWTKPEQPKKTRTVKFLGYRTGSGELVLIDESKADWIGCKRVPGADVTYEVEE